MHFVKHLKYNLSNKQTNALADIKTNKKIMVYIFKQ